MAKLKGLSLNATTHYNQWTGINALNVLPANAAAVALRAKFGLRAGLMTSDLALVALVAGRANADVSGIGKAKLLAKQTAADAYGLITGNAYSFADEAGLADLKTKMNNASSSNLFKGKDSNCAAKFTNLDTLLRGVIADNPVEAIEFFTVAQLDATALLAGDFGDLISAYAAAIADVRSAKKEFKTIWFRKMKGHVTFLTKMLGGAITTGFPAYAGSFMELIKLVNVGKRDQGLLAIMVDAITGKPFSLTATFEPLDYPVTVKPKLNRSNASGDLALMKLKVGLWKIKFSVPGYEDQTIELQINAKEVVKMTVKMKAV